MQRRTLLTIVALSLACLLSGVLFLGCGKPPQMGADDEVFHTVDALYTAVTARNEKLLDDCAQRLQTLHSSGKLPPSAAAYLDDVITSSRQGRWQPAAERLYTFMSAQRRAKPR